MMINRKDWAMEEFSFFSYILEFHYWAMACIVLPHFKMFVEINKSNPLAGFH